MAKDSCPIPPIVPKTHKKTWKSCGCFMCAKARKQAGISKQAKK